MAYESLLTNLVADGSHTRNRQRFKVLWIVGGITLVLFAFVGIVRRSTTLAPFAPYPVAEVPAVPAQPAALPAPLPAAPRIYLQAGDVGGEGIGSTLHHFKQSIVLSSALHSTLILASNDVKYNRPYSTSELFNGHRGSNAFSLDAYKTCRIQEHVPDRERLVRGYCEGEEWAKERMEQVRNDMADCTSFVDTHEGETTQDLNGCIMGWVRERLAPAPLHTLAPLTAPPTRPITVGVHIRWGDTAAAPDVDLSTHEFYGSWSLPPIVRVLADLRAFAAPHGIALTIAMENADPAVLGFLNETGYTLLDSGPAAALADLRALCQNDVLLLGESSYGVLAHLIAPPGLTIVQGGGFHKFLNTSGFGRHVVYLDDYTPKSLELVAEPLDVYVP